MAFCAISGNVPQEPVVSTKSGHLFERVLVEKYVRETGKCPITGEALSAADLLPLKTNKAVKPRTAPATSIPGLLGLFHDEWDALMLETHTLRQHLNSVRQELCHALYQHDAATRVIARLIRERDEARAALENARAHMQAEGSKRAAEDAGGEPAGKKARTPTIPEEVLAELTSVNTALSKGRKKREVPASLATPDDLGSMTLHASVPLHKTTAGGITCIELSPDAASGLVATGGVDATVQVFDQGTERQAGALEGHAKRITGLVWASSSVLLSSSADRTARIWRAGQGGAAGGAWECSATLKDHTAEVVGLTLHPSRKYFVTASADASWNFYDLEAATLLRSVSDESMREGYTAVQFHPDGLILGTATDANAIRIWEVKQQKSVATFGEHTRPVRSLAFSENGYYLASAAEDGVRLWDLRKLKVIKAITPYEDGPCNAVRFDQSGVYLGVGGVDARVYHTKQDWSVVRTFPDMPKKGVLSLAWGADARSLLVGTADHNLRVFTTPSA